MLNAEFKKGEHLDLRYRGITDLAEIGIELKFKGLERLDQNEMETLTHLEFLDLTWNRITSLAGLERLAKLRALYLSHNDIRKVAEVARLQPLAGTLTELSLCNNPLPREISDEASSIKGVKRLLELASIYDDDRPSGPCSSCNNWVNSGDGVRNCF